MTARERKAAIRKMLNQVEIARATITQLGNQLQALQTGIADAAGLDAPEATQSVSQSIEINGEMRSLIAVAWKDLERLESRV